MAFAQSDLDTIQAAIASGALRVRFADGREIHYQTTADLLAAEKRVAGVLARSTSSYQRIRTPAYRNGA